MEIPLFKIKKGKSFQGTEKDFIWLDEEPEMAIYSESLIRTMTTDGMILCTFTPLLGVSEVVLSFMPHLGMAVDVPVTAELDA